MILQVLPFIHIYIYINIKTRMPWAACNVNYYTGIYIRYYIDFKS